MTGADMSDVMSGVLREGGLRRLCTPSNVPVTIQMTKHSDVVLLTTYVPHFFFVTEAPLDGEGGQTSVRLEASELQVMLA